MASEANLGDTHWVSCPFCGVRSSLSIEVPATKPKAWRHECPKCHQFWKVSVGIRRGRAELNVEPDVPKKSAAKKAAPRKRAAKRKR